MPSSLEDVDCVVGVCVFEIMISESHSLKEKRQVLRRIKDGVKHKFHVSVAEVDGNDAWQRAALAYSVVGNDKRHVNSVLDQILGFVRGLPELSVTRHFMELLTYHPHAG